MRVLFLIGLLGLGGCAPGEIRRELADPVCSFLLPCAAPAPSPIRTQYTEIQVSPGELAARAQREAKERADAQAAEQAESRWRASPHWVTIRSVGPLQDAIVCDNFELVQFMMRRQMQYQADVLANNFMPQMALMRGKPQKPMPEAYGCTMVPKGTRVLADYSNMIPIIRVKLRKREVVGVTHPNFLSSGS